MPNSKCVQKQADPKQKVLNYLMEASKLVRDLGPKQFDKFRMLTEGLAVSLNGPEKFKEIDLLNFEKQIRNAREKAIFVQE